jgi:hypothetical protein
MGRPERAQKNPDERSNTDVYSNGNRREILGSRTFMKLRTFIIMIVNYYISF